MAAQYDIVLQSFTPVAGGPPRRTPLGVLPLRGGFSWSTELNNSGQFRFDVDGQAIGEELKQRIRFPRQFPSELVIYRTENGFTQAVQAGPLRARTLRGDGGTADRSVVIEGEGYLSYLKEMTYHQTGQYSQPIDQYRLVSGYIVLAQEQANISSTDAASQFADFWDMGFRRDFGHISGVDRQPGKKDPETGAFIEKPLWTQDGEYLFDIITRYSEGELGFDFAAIYSGEGDTIDFVMGENTTIDGVYPNPVSTAANRTLLRGFDRSDTVVFDSLESLSSYELVSSVAVGSTAAAALAVGPGHGESLPIDYLDVDGRVTTNIDNAVGTERRDDRHDPRIYAHAHDPEVWAQLGHRIKVLFFDDVFLGESDGRIPRGGTDPVLGTPVSRLASIAEKAEGVVELYKNQYEVLRAEILGTDQLPVTAYDIGDTIGYRLDTILDEYNATGRILKKTVTVGEDGVETVALELLTAAPVV